MKKGQELAAASDAACVVLDIDNLDGEIGLQKFYVPLWTTRLSLKHCSSRKYRIQKTGLKLMTVSTAMPSGHNLKKMRQNVKQIGRPKMRKKRLQNRNLERKRKKSTRAKANVCNFGLQFCSWDLSYL